MALTVSAYDLMCRSSGAAGCPLIRTYGRVRSARVQAAVVAGWWRYQRLSVGSRAERRALEVGEPEYAVAAAEAVEDRVRSGGPEALQLVAALVRTAETDDDLARVGAGPLEDLLSRNGAVLVDDIDELARRDPQFAQALTAVWWSADAAGPEVTSRLGRWIPALKR